MTKVLKGRTRVEVERFVVLRSHYSFDSFFCRPGVKGAHTPTSSRRERRATGFARRGLGARKKSP